MKINYKSYSIEYDYIYRNKDDTIIFLHGWGGNKYSFSFLFTYLQQYNILSISFPPYFTSQNYTDCFIELTLDDYKQIVNLIAKFHNITNAHIICHSFGFRVCLIITSCNFDIKKIIVTGGAGLNLKKTILKKITLYNKIIWNKKLKIFDKNLDINNLKNNDQKTFKNIIKIDLTQYANLIKCPILIFWGKQDKSTPYKVARLLKKRTKKSKLITVDSDHFAYLKFQNKFTKEVLNFLKEKL